MVMAIFTNESPAYGLCKRPVQKGKLLYSGINNDKM